MKESLSLASLQSSEDKLSVVLTLCAYEKPISAEALTQLFNLSPYKHYKLHQSAIKSAVTTIAEMQESEKLNEDNNIKENPKSIQIAERIDAQLSIKIDNEKMNVKAIITSAYGGNLITAQAFILQIKALKIVKGIDKKND